MVGKATAAELPSVMRNGRIIVASVNSDESPLPRFISAAGSGAPYLATSMLVQPMKGSFANTLPSTATTSTSTVTPAFALTFPVNAGACVPVPLAEYRPVLTPLGSWDVERSKPM